jgi:hypothetical protein
MSGICPSCGQDHHAVHVCEGKTWGKYPKDPEKQRAGANKRWEKYRADNKKRHADSQVKPPEPDPAPPVPEVKPTWRW